MAYSDPVPDDYIVLIKGAAKGLSDIAALAAMGEKAVQLLGGEITVLDKSGVTELFRFGQGGPHGTTPGMPHIHWCSGQSPYTGHHVVKMRHSGALHTEVESLDKMGEFLDRNGNPEHHSALPAGKFIVGEGDLKKAIPYEVTSLGPHYYIGKLLKALQNGWYKKAGGAVRFAAPAAAGH
jgi:hypothetical protein